MKKTSLALLQMDVHVNDVEYNYNRVQELLTQSLTEILILLFYLNLEHWLSPIQMILIKIADRNGKEQNHCSPPLQKNTR